MDEEIESPLAWSLGTSLRRVADDETFVSDSQILGKGEPWGEPPKMTTKALACGWLSTTFVSGHLRSPLAH